MITWPFGLKMDNVMFGFKNFCSLPSFHNLINGTHSSITKHVDPFSENTTIITRHGAIVWIVKLWFMTRNNLLTYL